MNEQVLAAGHGSFDAFKRVNRRLDAMEYRSQLVRGLALHFGQREEIR